MLFANTLCADTDRRIVVLVLVSCPKGHDGVQTLRTQDTSDPRHFGTSAELSVRHFGTGVSTAYQIQEALLMQRNHASILSVEIVQNAADVRRIAFEKACNR